MLQLAGGALALFLAGSVFACPEERDKRHLGQDKYPDLCVNEPFRSDIAQANLRRIVPSGSLSGAEIAETRKVARYEYLFDGPIEASRCPTTWVCPGKPSDSWYVVRRKTLFDLSAIKSSIDALLASHNTSGCSKLRVGSAGLSYITSSTVEFRAPVSFTKRWCIGDASGDIASGRGKLVVRVTLIKEEPSYLDADRLGSIRLEPAVHLADISATVLDLFDMNSFVGRVFVTVGDWLGKLLTGRSIEGDLKKALRTLQETDFGIYAAKAQASIGSARELAKILSSKDFGTKITYLFPEETEFVCEGSRQCGLSLAERQFTSARRMPMAYAFRACEIKAIKSLSKAKSLVRAAKQGDSLWAIARDEYCAGEMYLFLLALNPEIESRGLWVGDNVVVEPAYVFLEMAANVVNSGDSLWERWLASDRSVPWPVYRRTLPGSEDPDRIYPLQVDRARLSEVLRKQR